MQRKYNILLHIRFAETKPISLSILWVGTAKGQDSPVENFTVNHFVYNIEHDVNSVSLAGWDWESGAVPTGHINIPSTVTYKNKRYTVKKIFLNYSGVFLDITSVTIPSTIDSIGDRAFKECSKLESIIIPNSVKAIGKAAFRDCYSLKSIELSNSISLIDAYTFSYCPLESISIPNSVVAIGYSAFSDCQELSKVRLTDSLRYIGIEAFRDCKQLRSISLPESVRLIGDDAFEGCENLTSINCLKDNKLIDITSIPDYYQIFDHYESPKREIMLKLVGNGGELQVCGLTKDCIECFIPSEIEDFGSRMCTVEHIVTSISEKAFVGCISMESIYIPASVQSIGENAFYGCEKLQTIYIPLDTKERFKTILPTELHSKLKEIDFSNIEYYKTHELIVNDIETYTF